MIDYSKFRSLPAMFFAVAAERGDRPFLWAKHGGAYRPEPVQGPCEVGACPVYECAHAGALQ